jgi:hypothetical protein
MKPAEGSILVRVWADQKKDALIGDTVLKTGKNYNENFRERNPVVAYVEQGRKEIPTGSYIVCNYSYFDEESPLHLTDELYAIPVNEEIYAIINEDGSLNPVMGNLLVERVTRDSAIELPEELKKPHTDRGILLTETNAIKRGSFIFWLKMADYEIVFTWNNKEKRVLKIHKSEITGYLK